MSVRSVRAHRICLIIPASNSLQILLAKALQCTLTQKIGIALTLFRNVDNSFRDEFVSLIGPVGKSKGYASHLECDAHDARGLAVKLRTVQK